MKNKKIQSFGIFGQKITFKLTNWKVTIEIKKVNRTVPKFFGVTNYFSNLSENIEITRYQEILKNDNSETVHM